MSDKEKFSYVYVLVSSPKDNYYEQTLVSAATLRHYMPEARILVLVDGKTADSLTGARASLKDVVSEIRIAEDVPQDISGMLRSRFLKTSMYRYVEGDFLYIDADTFICRPLNEIESFPADIGAVPDKHVPLSRHQLKSRIERNARRLGYHAAFDDLHFNGGVMLCRKGETARNFFDRWHKLWKNSVEHGLCIDQAALAEADFLGGGCIQELPGIWNCQMEYGAAFLDCAMILHLFVTGDKYHRRPHRCMNPEFFDRVKSEGLSSEIMDAALHPDRQFEEKTQIIGGLAVDYYNTELSRVCCLLFCSSRWSRKIFDCLNFFARKILSFKK